MKKLIIFAFTLTLSGSLFAQRKYLTESQMLVDEARKDMNNIDYAKIDKAWQTLQPCFTDPTTSKDGNMWAHAALINLFFTNKMQSEMAANGNKLKDPDAFFEIQAKICQYYSKADSLYHSLNAKGKPVMKAEDAKTNHDQVQKQAIGIRPNLLVAGSNYVYSNFDLAKKYLELYLSTFDDPLYSELNLNETDNSKYDAYLFYGASVLNFAKTAADSLNAAEYFKKSLKSTNNAQSAYANLMDIYRAQGNMEEWAKYCGEGIEKFPDQHAFVINLLNYRMGKEDWAEAERLSKIMMERFPDNILGFYFNAVVLYKTDKLVESLTAFEKATQLDPNHCDSWAGYGNSAWMLAQKNADKKAVRDDYYKKAIDGYEHAREADPDRSDVWGYPLYAIYNNSGNLTKAAQYKKYSK